MMSLTKQNFLLNETYPGYATAVHTHFQLSDHIIKVKTFFLQSSFLFFREEHSHGIVTSNKYTNRATRR